MRNRVTQKTFKAYRFGTGRSGSLVNKNAGNRTSVANRLCVFDDWDSPQSINSNADRVSIYRVTAEEFGEYVAMNGGKPQNKILITTENIKSVDREVASGVVGRIEHINFVTGEPSGAVSYSFTDTGYTVEKIGEITLTKLRADMKAKHGYESFDMAGGKITETVLAEAEKNI
jgi:hypothetical protein